jgi:hypothetical protein
MSKPLAYKSLKNLGVNGLNTQDNPTSLDPSWMIQADNLVLREGDRITTRKGLKQQVLSGASKIGAIAECKHGNVVASIGSYLYVVNLATPDTPWTSAFDTGAGDSDWQLVEFNNDLYCFQQGEEPVEHTASTFSLLTSNQHYSAPSGVSTFNPSCASGYYGRLWAGGVSGTEDVLYYSDTLIPAKWSGGSSGYIDLKTVWGSDEIVAVEPFMGQLVIFGKENIVLYKNPSSPSSMELSEVIRGIGTVSRDSVRAVADDLFFLSETGLRSLNRTTQLDKLPLTELSINIKDDITSLIKEDTNVKGCYVQDEGLYLLSFVNKRITYVFDIAHKTSSGVPRIYKWIFNNTHTPTSLTFGVSRGFLIGTEDGSISKYTGYYDSQYVSGGSYVDSTYSTVFSTPWVDLGDSIGASLLKQLRLIIDGGSGSTTTLSTFLDLSNTAEQSEAIVLDASDSGTPAQFGISEFNIGEFTRLLFLTEFKTHMSGSAKFLRLQLSTVVSGFSSAFQSLTLLYKQGKLR